MVNIGENILESSETNFMNLPPYVFDVDHVAKIRSELSIAVLEKKMNKKGDLRIQFLIVLKPAKKEKRFPRRSRPALKKPKLQMTNYLGHDQYRDYMRWRKAE